MSSTKKIILPLLLLFAITAKAQQITGLWYSADSSRIYQIKTSGNDQFEAVIYASTRKDDIIGYSAMKNLQYNKHKKRYEGIMYAVTDGQSCFTKIKFNKDSSNQLTLKLSRMFILDAKLSWRRVKKDPMASP
jgi:hypothetical protein